MAQTRGQDRQNVAQDLRLCRRRAQQGHMGWYVQEGNDGARWVAALVLEELPEEFSAV